MGSRGQLSALLTALLGVLSLMLAAPSRSHAGEGQPVAEVEFRGLVSLDPVALRRAIATRAGGRYRMDVVNQDILRLERLKIFERITVSTEQTPSGLRVIFRVAERPVVRSISVVGARQIRAATVRGYATRTKVGRRYDPAGASFDAYDMREMLREYAFRDARVAVDTVPMEGAGKGRPAGVEVVFTITEGEVVRVRAVAFEGNEVLTDKECHRLVKVRAKHWYNQGAFEDWRLEWDAASVRAAYRSKGYLDAEVKVVRGEPDADEAGRKWVDVTFNIEEGTQYKVGSVAVEGNTLVTSEKIIEAMRLKPGDVYSEEARMLASQGAFGLYGDMGRVFSNIFVGMSLADRPGTVDLAVKIGEGEVVSVREITFLGNTKTKDVVLRREMQLFPGERFDWTKYRDSMRRLQRLEYFSKLVPDLQRTEDPTKTDIVVEVEEKMTGLFQMGVALSSNDDTMFNIQLSQRNFDVWDWPKSWGDFASGNAFVGDGQKLSLTALFGDVRQSFSVQWVEPWLFNRPVQLGISAYDTLREDSDYDEERAGGRASLSKRWRSGWSVGLFGEMQNVRIDDIDSSVPALSPIRAEEGLNRINSVGWSLGYEGRDSRLFPTEGVHMRLSEEVAGGGLGGDKDFLKHSALLAGHIPVGWRARSRKKPPPVFSLRVKGDWVVPYGDSSEVPIYEKFYAGGIGYVRGYDFRSISPRYPDVWGDEVGGELRLLETAELTFPLAGEKGELRGALFFDAGNVWADPNDFDFDDQKLSWGFGIIMLIPGQGAFLPFKIYWGYPIDAEPWDDTERVSFTFGSYF